MKGVLFFLCTALLMFGCSSPETDRADLVRPVLDAESKWIVDPGDYRVGDTWVSVDSRDRKLTISHVTTKAEPGMSSTSTSSSSPEGWRAHEGWFAFMQEDGKKVWMYDGRESLLLATWKRSEKENASSIYGPGNFPVQVPEAVLARLKEPFRTKIKAGRRG